MIVNIKTYIINIFIMEQLIISENENNTSIDNNDMNNNDIDINNNAMDNNDMDNNDMDNNNINDIYNIRVRFDIRELFNFKKLYCKHNTNNNKLMYLEQNGYKMSLGTLNKILFVIYTNRINSNVKKYNNQDVVNIKNILKKHKKKIISTMLVELKDKGHNIDYKTLHKIIFGKY